MPDPLHDLIPHFDPIDARSVVERAQRRRRTTVGALVAILVVALAAIVVPTVVVPSVAGRTARPQVTAATPSAVPSATSGAPSPSAAIGRCGLSELPAAWTSARKPTTLTPATGVYLQAADASTGRKLYLRESPNRVVVVNPDGREGVLFSAGSGMAFVGFALAGDWAAVTESSGDLSVHAVYARRVTGGQVIELAKQAPDGSGPTGDVVVYNGSAYLLVGSTTSAVLVKVDLETGTRTEWPVARGGSGLVRWGHQLIWEAGSPRSAVSFDVLTQQLVDVPAQLASMGGAWQIASDGDTLVWEGTGPTTGWVRAFRNGWSSVREYALPAQLANPGLSSWGRYATVLVADRQWILDVETGQYAPVTTSWGGAIATGGVLATSEMGTQKGGSAGLYELDLTSVPPLPGCTR